MSQLPFKLGDLVVVPVEYDILDVPLLQSLVATAQRQQPSNASIDPFDFQEKAKRHTKHIHVGIIYNITKISDKVCVMEGVVKTLRYKLKLSWMSNSHNYYNFFRYNYELGTPVTLVKKLDRFNDLHKAIKDTLVMQGVLCPDPSQRGIAGMVHKAVKSNEVQDG
jgi:hypothetical protein